MKRLGDGRLGWCRHDKHVNALTLGRTYSFYWSAKVPVLSRQLHVQIITVFTRARGSGVQALAVAAPLLTVPGSRSEVLAARTRA